VPTVATIRYYEQIGLLRPATRSGGQRTYDHEDVRRLSFIRRCREFDFSIEDIRALLSSRHNGKSCTEARRLAESRLVELRRRRVELQALESTIASLVTACANTCDAMRWRGSARLCNPAGALKRSAASRGDRRYRPPS
jgi:DNA-binding transcriptional MerR regulator